MAKPDEYLARFVHSNKFISFFFPFYGWQVYLYGLPDGSHFFPFSADRMWKDSPVNEKIKCVISSLVCVGCLATLYYAAGQSLSTLAYYYLGPYIMFSWWLVTVTYLQHHSHDTLVYDDKDWKFVDAAFETVDRSFGFGIDSLHHHITDGHVVHHLFFTKIPHYNLPIATKAVKSYLEQNDLGWMYKYDKTYDFPYRVHSYMTNFGFKSTRASLVGDRKAHVMKKKE